MSEGECLMSNGLMRINRAKIAEFVRSPFLGGLIFALMLFVKCVLFNWYAFHQLLISSLWTNSATFWGYYLPKLAMAIGVASFFLLCNRKWVTITFSFIIDIWIIINLMYIRSYGMVIDAFSITMIGNLSGFESSLPLYLRWSDILFPLLTLSYIPLCYTRTQGHLRVITACIGLLFAIAGGYIGQYSYMKAHSTYDRFTVFDFHWRLFSRDARQSIYGVELTYPTQQTSILHAIGYDIADLCQYFYEKSHPYQLTHFEKSQIGRFYNDAAPETTINNAGPLIIVIVESFENWVFTPDVMPNLSSFCDNHYVLYANHVQSQVRGGMSADGQMMINTGLLPTLEGAACYRFPHNEYPGIMHHLNGKSATLVPHNVDVWNQSFMSQAYGYDTTVQVSAVDTILFREVLQYLHLGYSNIQMLTMSTHSPFTTGAALSTYEVDEDMPELRKNYIKAFNTLDNGLEILLEAVDTDSALQNVTLVITGDHIIWPEPAYCPLIIYSPHFTSSIAYTEPCYQMDIYPTLADVLGIEPKWQGLGISLLSHIARNITLEQALDLSDKMHRANYFAHVEDNFPCYIAHAGGAIDGFYYTNSLEAVNYALGNGIRYIELDLAFTREDSLVASHSWMGCEDIVGDNLPSYAEFINHKIYSRFTPLDYARIDSIMQSNPNLHLVTDKISDADIIKKYFGKYKHRLIVECFSDEDYRQLKKDGYEVFRSEYPLTKKGVIKMMLKFSFHDSSIDTYVFDGVNRESFAALHGDAFALYSCANRQEADSLFAKDSRIKYIYIDDVER